MMYNLNVVPVGKDFVLEAENEQKKIIVKIDTYRNKVSMFVDKKGAEVTDKDKADIAKSVRKALSKPNVDLSIINKALKRSGW